MILLELRVGCLGQGVATRVLLGEGVKHDGRFWAENAGVCASRYYSVCTIASWG